MCSNTLLWNVQALSPVVCSFAASALPFLFLPDHPLYPLLNFTLLKHSALSLLLQDACMPLTLMASRQPLLGSDGVFSRLLLSPSAATSAIQKKFLLLVLKRAMAASRCIEDGSVSLSLRLQAHKTTQAVLPPPAVLAVSVLPSLASLTYNPALVRRVLDSLLVSTAAPACLSDCSWWIAHPAFRLAAARAAAGESDGKDRNQVKASGNVPLATVNAQHLLQRFGILVWINAQLEAVLTSHVLPTQTHSSAEDLVAIEYTGLLSQPVPLPRFLTITSDCAVSCPKAFETSKMLPILKDITRLLWSVIGASTLTATLPDAEGTHQRSNSQAQASGRGEAVETSSGTFPHERIPASWLPSTPSADQSLRVVVMGARRQLFSLRRLVDRDEVEAEGKQSQAAVAEESGALRASCNGQTTTAAKSRLWSQAEKARQLQLDLLQGIERLARTWFAFGVAAGCFVRTTDGYAVSSGLSAGISDLAASLQQASLACVSALWAVVSCSQSVGVFVAPNDGGDTANIFVIQQQLQASECCADVLRLCTWTAALHAGGSFTDRGSKDERGQLSKVACGASSLCRRVLAFLCKNKSPVCAPAPNLYAADAPWTGRLVHLALLQIKDMCNEDYLLQELIAAAAGL